MTNYKLRNLMVEQGMTMRKLAELSGLSMRAVARAREGIAGIRVASQIALVLGVPIAVLFPGSVARWQQWGGFRRPKKEYEEI